MIPFLSTLAALTALVVMTDAVCWVLFRRKMQTMALPAPNGNSATSSTYYLRKLRFITVMHAIVMIVFLWMFCSYIWW